MKALQTMVLAEGFYLLEAPRWRDGALWMSDTIGGKVYRLDLSGRARVVADVPHRAETFAQRLTSFAIGSNGQLQDRRILADLGSIAPDGICLDQDGAVWLAASRRPDFVRVVDGGRITHQIETPGQQAVACALGGQDGRTLFCLTVAGEFEDVPGCAATARVEIAKVAIPAQGIWDA